MSKFCPSLTGGSINICDPGREIVVKTGVKGRRVGNDLILPIYREVEHRVRRRMRGSRAMWANACASLNPGSVKIFAQTLFCPAAVLTCYGFKVIYWPPRDICSEDPASWKTQRTYNKPSQPPPPPLFNLKLNCVKSSQPNLILSLI